MTHAANPTTPPNFPATHSLHNDRPVPSWNLPKGQTTQAPRPVTFANLPWSQARHDNCSGTPTANPRAQGPQLVEPLPDCADPIEHGIHADEPLTPVKRPPAQVAHVPCFGRPVALPARHRSQLDRLVRGWARPGKQSRHRVLALALLNVPTPHTKHDVRPTVPENSPITQSPHVEVALAD